MKALLIIIIMLLVTHPYVFGQSETVTLLGKADSIENLFSEKWKLLSSTTGDLNNDGVDDLVFVIEKTDKNNFHLNEGHFGRDTINLNPRIMGIYFRNKNGKLVKQLQSNSFIILQDSPTMDEPFHGVEILEKGVLKIDFHFWYSAGSWSMSYHTYKFRFQNNKFELIGYDANERHRGSGEETDYNINFSTYEMNITKTIFDENDDRIIKEENKTFILKELKSIQSLGKPFEWEFKGIHL